MPELRGSDFEENFSKESQIKIKVKIKIDNSNKIEKEEKKEETIHKTVLTP